MSNPMHAALHEITDVPGIEDIAVHEGDDLAETDWDMSVTLWGHGTIAQSDRVEKIAARYGYTVDTWFSVPGEMATGYFEKAGT